MSTQATTWEEAATAAAAKVFNQPYEYVDSLDEVDSLLGIAVDELIPIDFARMGALALQEANRGRPQTMGATLNDIVATIIIKQHDYGHQNILRHGLTGVVVRMCDKVERIKNLQRRLGGPVAVDEVALNEPLADSWGDLVGYSIIGIMLLDGTFKLPLKRDIPQAQPGKLQLHADQSVNLFVGDNVYTIYKITTDNGVDYVHDISIDGWGEDKGEPF